MKLEPVKCACGRKPDVYTIDMVAVECVGRWCWAGPPRKTRRAAILAWNRVMAKKGQGTR